MLYILGIVIGLVFIIICFSNGLKERNALEGRSNERPGRNENLPNKKKQKDLCEEDFTLLAKILSVGLVDADPHYLHHLKGYRDLGGASA